MAIGRRLKKSLKMSALAGDMAAVRQHPHRLGRDGNTNGSAIESSRSD